MGLGRLHLLPELTGICLDRQSGLGPTGTTPGPAPVIRLAIPKDDAAPDAPFVTITKGDLEALDADGARPADPLRSSQFCGLLREEQLVAALAATSSQLLQLS